MNSLNIFSPVQISLISGQDGKSTAHDGDGGHCGGAEHPEVHGGHGTRGVEDALFDTVGQSGENWDGAEGETIESGFSADFIGNGSPAETTDKISACHCLEKNRQIKARFL